MSLSSSFVDIKWADRPVSIEYQWISSDTPNAPLLIFLHEGLGSVAMWRDFPQNLCAAAGVQGLVYSRPGYGQSSKRHPDENWDVDFMHRQAHEVLPALLSALHIAPNKQAVWLFGHSDGGSIALLYAAQFPDHLAGVIVMAPHIFVEDVTISSIERVRRTYLETNLAQRLARYHDDPDSPFWAWNNIWLLPAFRQWNIENELTEIRCPVLAMQGVQDEYGTLEQIHGIKRKVPSAQLAEVDNCGHSPHRDQPEELTLLTMHFLNNYTGGITQ